VVAEGEPGGRVEDAIRNSGTRATQSGGVLASGADGQSLLKHYRLVAWKDAQAF
jgi:hypothetical protein